MRSLAELKLRLAEVSALMNAVALLRWDQQTYLPVRGGSARARQLATLSSLAHEKFTDVEVGRLLDRAEQETAALPPDSDDASLVRVTRQLYDRARRVPASLVAELDEHSARTYQAWTLAQPANDFESLRPMLEKTLELSRRKANCFPAYESVIDPLIEGDDFGITAATVRALFAELRAGLLPLLEGLSPADDSCLRQHAPAAEQLSFATEVIRAFGFDFERGRLDLTAHPFTTKFSVNDVRITTRVREDHLTHALFVTLHECGHGLYEQGIRPELEGTPLANVASFGVDESQSRLWENLVGRSRAFWEYLYPKMQAAFPKQLGGVVLDTFYRAINRVERTLFRGFADEVTYNLHIMLRFGLELDLLEGTLAVKDLPRAWRERFEEDLGLSVPDDRMGCLQDVHWYSGQIGGVFQGYALGNVLSAQFFAAAVAAQPQIPKEISRGQFGTLLSWLRSNIHQHGAKFTASELVHRATGTELSARPYLDYLKAKYGREF